MKLLREPLLAILVGLAVLTCYVLAAGSALFRAADFKRNKLRAFIALHRETSHENQSPT